MYKLIVKSEKAGGDMLDLSILIKPGDGYVVS